MGTNLHQNDTGGLIWQNDADGIADAQIGGPKTPTVTNPRFYGQRMMKLPFVGGVDTAAGLLAWQNTLGYDIVVQRLVLDITTQSTGTCAVQAGQATSSTATSANLIDTLSVASTGDFDNVTDKGANGKSRQKILKLQWFTLSTISGTSTGLVGNAYIDLYPV